MCALCNSPETPTQWKSECEPTDQPTQLLEMLTHLKTSIIVCKMSPVFLVAIASPSTYPCQWVSQSVSADS